jgi:hypothetical protein
MTDDEAVARMIKAFWELRLFGVDCLEGFTCDSTGTISPQPSNVSPAWSNGAYGYGNGSYNIPQAWYLDDGSYDLGEEVLEAITLFAAYQIAIIAAQNLSSMVKYQAGSVSTETQKSAALQQLVLTSLKSKTNMALTRLSDLGTTSVTVVDKVIETLDNEARGISFWIR